MPSVLTFNLSVPTTVNPIIQNNLVTVFVDGDDTLNIDYRQLNKALSKKTTGSAQKEVEGKPASSKKAPSLKKAAWPFPQCMGLLPQKSSRN
jgi:CDP-6-deoxy-D-xylo-4-hexulose-3-dehydrase